LRFWIYASCNYEALIVVTSIRTAGVVKMLFCDAELGVFKLHQSTNPVNTGFAALMCHRQRSFTLIKLMVVLRIIGVLAVLIVPNVLDRADDARVATTKWDTANMHSSPDAPRCP